MAQIISPRVSHFRALLSPSGPLPRAGVTFKHVVSPGSPPAAGVHMTAGLRAHSSSIAGTRGAKAAAAQWWRTARALRCSSARGQAAWRGRFALGAALGATATALVQFLHTGAAMALKVNLHVAEGDWKEVKALLQSLSLEDRRQYYRTSGFVLLDDIPLWTPPAGASESSRIQRNEKLDQKISVYRGDITRLEIGAIVNAANNTLLGGGGVDGAIHKAAGPWLKKECASLHGCETGDAKITCGYGLPAKYVIHTVGPIVKGRVGETERNKLRLCYMNSLKMATEKSARTVAFPCISTGIYGYPPELAVHEALATVREYLDVHHDKLDRVIFCVFSPTDKQLYLENLPLYFPGAPTEATVKSKL